VSHHLEVDAMAPSELTDHRHGAGVVRVRDITVTMKPAARPRRRRGASGGALGGVLPPGRPLPRHRVLL